MNRYQTLAYQAGVLACALIFLLGPLPATAQTTGLSVTTASLRLWPEYDDPGLLVIFAGDFSTATGFPRDVSFPLPAGARNIQAAYPDAAGGLLVAASETSADQLTFRQLPVPAFHIEYYIDRQPSGDRREITYLFEAPFAIEALQISVQQPARATDFSVSPAPESTFMGDDGLTYSTFGRANLVAGNRLEIVMRYVKTDSGVSSPQLAVTTANTAPAPAPPASAGVGSWLPLVLIIVGTAALVGLLTYWLLSQRQARRLLPAARSPGRQDPAGDTAFCTQCGHAYGKDDRYCAQCGAPRPVRSTGGGRLR